MKTEQFPTSLLHSFELLTIRQDHFMMSSLKGYTNSETITTRTLNTVPNLILPLSVRLDTDVLVNSLCLVFLLLPLASPTQYMVLYYSFFKNKGRKSQGYTYVMDVVLKWKFKAMCICVDRNNRHVFSHA